MAATKTKKQSKPAKRSKPKGIQHSFVGVQTPFGPGEKVTVHDAFGISAAEGLPSGKPLSTATVSKDGSLEVRVPKKGRYVVAGETDDGPRRVEFTVN